MLNNLSKESEPKKKKFMKRLLAWYSSNKRSYFFWRKTKNPYYILISEMMLQKTTTNQVQKIVEKFIKRYSSPKKLAESPLQEIKELITPLGMEHKRTARFKESAKMIKEKFNGKIPDNETDLMALPGVGQYIANSVLCLAYGKQVPLLDTNIVRILERVFELKSAKSRARTDQTIWNFVKEISPEKRARDTNLALLDFGALVCTSKKPKCQICPMNDFCFFFNNR